MPRLKGRWTGFVQIFQRNSQFRHVELNHSATGEMHGNQALSVINREKFQELITIAPVYTAKTSSMDLIEPQTGQYPHAGFFATTFPTIAANNQHEGLFFGQIRNIADGNHSVL